MQCLLLCRSIIGGAGLFQESGAVYVKAFLPNDILTLVTPIFEYCDVQPLLHRCIIHKNMTI